MIYGLCVNTKPDPLKDIVHSIDEVQKRLATNDGPWRLVSDPKHEMPTAFIGDCNTVLSQFFTIE